MAINSSSGRSAAVALALALCCAAVAAVSADAASRGAVGVTASRGAVQEASRASYKKKGSYYKDDYYYSVSAHSLKLRVSLFMHQ